MIDKLILSLAEDVATRVAAGFSFEAVGYLKEDKVVKQTPNGLKEIGPDDRRGNYFYIRHTNAALTFTPSGRGACANEYEAAASLRLVMQSSCISADKMKAAAVSALANARAVALPNAKLKRVRIVEAGEGVNIAEAVENAKAALIYVDFNLVALLDLKECKNVELC
jgi:hypothetical protein